MNKIALITGATSGIGEATALLLAQNNYNLIITGRREEKLSLLKENIQQETNTEILTLNFDIRSLDETKTAISNLPLHWKNIDVLINNAGLAVGYNTIQDGVIDDWERMIDTNIKGLLYITRLVSPIMVERSKGILLISHQLLAKKLTLSEMFTVQLNTPFSLLQKGCVSTC